MTESIPMLHHHYTDAYRDNRYGTNLDTLILANQMSAGHQHIGDKIHTASVNGIKETADAARDTVDAVRDSISATNQLGNINLQSTERTASETRSAVERNGGETRSSVERNGGETRHAIDVASNQIARDFAGVHRDICQTRQEMATGFGNVQLEACKQHAAIQLEMCKQHAELARQIDARAAEAAKQLAECCCATKELVRAENSATRQLIQNNALDDCRRRESALQNDLNLLKLSAQIGGNGPGPFSAK